jgi:DNA ligase-1
MRLIDLVQTSERVAATSSRNEKVRLVAGCIAAAPVEEVPLVVAYLSGELPQGRIGVGPAALRKAFPAAAALEPTLAVADVDAAFTRLSGLSGPGSTGERVRRLGSLLERATEPEQRFLAALVFGELRQGALGGVMLSAIGRVADVPAARVRRAHTLSGDASRVAATALAQGGSGLARLELELFRPLRPMLAQSADGVAEAMARVSPAIVDQKLDGARVQVHRRGDDVRVYSRSLRDVTEAVPEVVEVVLGMPATRLVLDGEAIALDEAGRPAPFQTTMSRFGRKRDVADQRRDLPLTPVFFDCLHRDGATLVDLPLEDRLDHLDRVVPETLRAPRIATSEPEAAEAFFGAVLERGHEGVMVKDPTAAYEAGRRGRGWIKVKQAHTLDLVVLAAEWGHGRRRGRLSNLHLGARGPEGEWVMLGKTFKGMTDEVLAWQTERLLELAVAREGHVVRVRPELVVEIAFNEVQASPRYPGGVALRFARLKGYRPDKTAAEADTIETVRRIQGGGSATPGRPAER